jgi:hypothetical protein
MIVIYIKIVKRERKPKSQKTNRIGLLNIGMLFLARLWTLYPIILKIFALLLEHYRSENWA